MTTYYWTGGSGVWSATNTSNWSTSNATPRTGGFGPPTAADIAIFEANSNVTAYTVTVASTAIAQDASISGPAAGAVTIAGSNLWVIVNNLTVAGSGVTWTSTGTITFNSTTAGNTISTGNVNLTVAITLDGVGGSWSLGNAFTCSSAVGLTLTNGTFNTANYNMTLTGATTGLSSNNPNPRSMTLGSSTINISGTNAVNFATSTNMTLNAGTSNIICNNINTTFAAGATGSPGLTFYDVYMINNGLGTHTISGPSAAFHNLNITSRSSAGVRVVQFSDNVTVTGTLTFGSANLGSTRMIVHSSNNTNTSRHKCCSSKCCFKISLL